MTIRSATTFVVFAILSAWASAQSTGIVRTADEHRRLFQQNQRLLEDLLDNAVILSDSEETLERLDVCRKTAERLSRELAPAVERDDADRFTEISEQWQEIVSDGLIPTLDTARRDITPGSPGYARLQEIHRQTWSDSNRVDAVFPRQGQLAERPQIRELRIQFLALLRKIGEPTN